MSLESVSEVWRPIPGWEGLYEASTLGRIRSVERLVEQISRWGTPMTRRYAAKPRRLETGPYGYLMVKLSRDGAAVTKAVHVLICETFHGARPHRLEVAHRDGIKANNAASNMRWATHSENVADKIEHGTVAFGATHPTAKLDINSAKQIFHGRDPLKVAAERHSVSITTISSIRRGKTWARALAA